MWWNRFYSVSMSHLHRHMHAYRWSWRYSNEHVSTARQPARTHTHTQCALVIIVPSWSTIRLNLNASVKTPWNHLIDLSEMSTVAADYSVWLCKHKRRWNRRDRRWEGEKRKMKRRIDSASLACVVYLIGNSSHTHTDTQFLFCSLFYRLSRRAHFVDPINRIRFGSVFSFYHFEGVHRAHTHTHAHPHAYENPLRHRENDNGAKHLTGGVRQPGHRILLIFVYIAIFRLVDEYFLFSAAARHTGDRYLSLCAGYRVSLCADWRTVRRGPVRWDRVRCECFCVDHISIRNRTHKCESWLKTRWIEPIE